MSADIASSPIDLLDFPSLMAEFEKLVRRGGSGSDFLIQLARNFFHGARIAVSVGDLERLSAGNREVLWQFMNVYSLPDRCHDRLAEFADVLDGIAKERGLDKRRAK